MHYYQLLRSDHTSKFVHIYGRTTFSLYLRCISCIRSRGVIRTLSKYMMEPFSEAVAQRCSVKEVLIEISHFHRKTPVPETLFLLVRLSIFASANRGSLGCLSSLKFIILGALF